MKRQRKEEMKKRSIFISHSHSDHRLAKRFQELISAAGSDSFQIHRSSEEGEIKTGEDWKKWIDQRVLDCDVAIVLLTPAALRGRWVMWEAGAVAGVQYERENNTTNNEESNGELATRRVRVVKFNLANTDLGPFGSIQTRDGLNQAHMVEIVKELLYDLLDTRSKEFMKGLLKLEEYCTGFVEDAREALRFTPLGVDESMVQTWLGRIDEAIENKEYHWVSSAQRWVNVAFLGAGKANGKEPIDLRLHMRLAEGLSNIDSQWQAAIDELKLAELLSPNDIVVLRKLGSMYRRFKNNGTQHVQELQRTLDRMVELDPDIFKEDREGIALKCGFFVDQSKYPEAESLLSEANPALVRNDGYLLGWLALATMFYRGTEAALPHFRELEKLMEARGEGFFDFASQVNGLLAQKRYEDATGVLKRMVSLDHSQKEWDSASRYFDQIISKFDQEGKYDWRSVVKSSSR